MILHLDRSTPIYTLFLRPETETERKLCEMLGFAWLRKLNVYATTSRILALRAMTKLDESFARTAEALDWARVASVMVEQGCARDDTCLPPTGAFSGQDLGDLYPFQRVGAMSILGRGRVLLADQMGLGKTVQVCAALRKFWANTPGAKTLIICPASMKQVWRDELIRWTGISEGEIRVISGIAHQSWLSTGLAARAYILNYDILRAHMTELRRITWPIAVLDECHYLKNPDTARTRAVIGHGLDVGIKAGIKVALSGTPLVNRPIELYPVLRWLDPLGWPDRWWYAKRYCAAHQGKWGWDLTGASNLEELQARLRETVMVRRLKQEVLQDLPPKIRQVIPVEPDEAAKALLDEEAADLEELGLEEKIEEALRLDSEAALQAVAKALDGVRVRLEAVASRRQALGMTKYPVLKAHLENILESNGKVVVFAHHRLLLQRLHETFPGSVLYTGSTAQGDRGRVVQAFQSDPDVKLFFGQIQAAGIGITLTASSHIVFAETSWTPGDLLQAEDRCHRIGQKESLLIQYFIYNKSVDAYVFQVAMAKQKILERVLNRKETT